MLQSFDDYRDKMLSIMANAEARLGHHVPADTAALDLGRARMSRILTAYHMFADRELFGPCIGRDAAQGLRIKAVAAECATLTSDFRAFTRDCAARPVIARWATYRLDSLAMIGRVRQHLVNAEAEARVCEVQSTATRLGYRSAA
ncbi:hypothetical protein [Sphingomonas abietis]|uniref:Hemerythrin domain-containing protein n=1 Tax=Sphingomonas abietis TaxID=3012344 RepID=A0ABY7NKM9_9SPHN|nr:hypothetical protein [Sphingomonas abietis]WBO21903.1 hypothetical protein PBT88_17315 [Sphingomonas abietis]